MTAIEAMGLKESTPATIVNAHAASTATRAKGGVGRFRRNCLVRLRMTTTVSHAVPEMPRAKPALPGTLVPASSMVMAGRSE
jgi:hypothetical protein